MTTGIYKITNLVNGKVYIGASKNIEKRWGEHKSKTSSPIHSDLEALGTENFKFEVLIECPEDMLCQWERDMICLYDADDPEKGYNSKDDRPYSLKISETLKGHKAWNRGLKSNKPAWNKGLKNIYSDETRRKRSETLKGHKAWNRGLKSNKPAWNKGIPHSEETKRKISEALKRRLSEKKEDDETKRD